MIARVILPECAVSLHLLVDDEGPAYLAIDPSEAVLPGEGDQFVDVERDLLETPSGPPLGFEVRRDGGVIRLKRRRFHTVADFAEAGEVLLVGPENGFGSIVHGQLLSVVAAASTVAGRGAATNRAPEGLAA